MNEINDFAGLVNVREVFDNIPNDKQLGKLLRYPQTLDLARIAGVALDKRYIREPDLIAMIREKFQQGPVVPPKCNCEGLGEGLRWVKSDNAEDVCYSISQAAMDVFPDAEQYIHEAMAYVSALAPRLRLRPAKAGEKVNIAIDAGPFDGLGGTLGVTSFYRSRDNDLDVFSGSEPAVRILMDTAEFWTRDYFRTVFRHEVIHAVGIGHSETRGDLMYAYYTGINLGKPGVWTLDQIDMRYIQNLAA